MEKHKVLERLLEELHKFLKILDAEKLSGNAALHKSLVTDLLLSYRSNGAAGDEEYIYMNKVIVTNQGQTPADRDNRSEREVNGKYSPGPLKSLPELPQPRSCVLGREPFPLPALPSESTEGYYEEAQPYDTTINDDCEAVSSSYESYDEEEVSKGKSSAAAHQWPSTEASIELMRDARICAFLWRKKWLGQWAKQLCVIRDTRLLCYKSSKEQTPLLDVSLLGCCVIYKEKQLKKKEHKLRIIPQGGEAIVLGLQSKEQTEQWLKVIQDISPKSTEGFDSSDSPRLICTKGELGERHSVASESGSSTDSHVETLEAKEVKKKHGGGLKFSNLMNIGKKKMSSFDSPEKCVDTSGYLNVLVNNQWRSRWCLIKNGQLWVYQDKSKGKMAQQPVPLGGCLILPDPSPEHLYSFRIQMDGEQLATLEAKSSAEMGHWLGLLLSQTGSKTDPEELAYDYVNSERISSIVNAAKTSMYLMQRRFSEPNTYTDNPSDMAGLDDIYDDVASTENEMEEGQENGSCGSGGGGEVLTVAQDSKERVYLDMVPVRSFLHTSPDRISPSTSVPSSTPVAVTSSSSASSSSMSSSSTNQNQTEAPPQPPPRDPIPSPSPASPVDGNPECQEGAYQDVLPNKPKYESRLTAEALQPSRPELEVPSSPGPLSQPQTQSNPNNQNQKEVKVPSLSQNQLKDQSQNQSQNQSQTKLQSQNQSQSKIQSQNQTPNQNQSKVQAKQQLSSFLSQETAKRTNVNNCNSTTTTSASTNSPTTTNAPISTPTATGTSFTSTSSVTVLGSPHQLQAPTVPTQSHSPHSPQVPRGRTVNSDKARLPVAGGCSGSIEVKLGKNRTEADVRRYTDERDRLEKEREEVKNHLATFRKERREAKEELATCQDPAKQAVLEACLKLREEACREAELRRVEVELLLVEVKENLRKVEAGPFTLGTTVDSSLLEVPPVKASPSSPPTTTAPTSNGDASPVNSATALKNRPVSIIAHKGNVLQKAKEWEKKKAS